MASVMVEENRLAEMFAEVLPHLDERDRRILVGGMARMLGRGGIVLISRASGLSDMTVSKGAWELSMEVEPSSPVRAAGGGRKKVELTDPQLVADLDALVSPEARGDPMGPLRWTTKSTRHLAETLCAGGHEVSAWTVARILKMTLRYRLQANAKTREGAQHADRDGQFRYINDQAASFLAAQQPVISVDCKKKELVCEFKNGGTEWAPQGKPTEVNTYDFPQMAIGKAIPYGIYDIGANSGWVTVGNDHDTPTFAVAAIGSWWDTVGRARYPNATRLLITADGGGSNSSRSRVFKVQLAELAANTGLEITLCHYPPGTSKWNKVEHRLFSFITINWRGRPLTSYETVIETIGTTTTTTGLTVHAELDAGTYPTGVKISDKAMKELEQNTIVRHDWHGEWNYMISPRRQ